jgi:hypothetical protein
MWEELPPLRLEPEMDAISLAPSRSRSLHFRDAAVLPVALPNTSRYDAYQPSSHSASWPKR